MRVLFLSTRDVVGGAAKAAYRLLCALRCRNVDIEMFVADKSSQDAYVKEIKKLHYTNILSKYTYKIMMRIYDRITTYNARRRSRKQREKTVYELYVGNLFGGWYGEQLKNKDRYDVVHIHWVDAFVDYRKLKDIKQPIVITLHDCGFFTGGCHHFGQCQLYKTCCDSSECALLGSKIVRLLIRENIRRKVAFIKKHSQLHIVAPSTWMAQCARQSALLKDVPISVIPNPIDVNLYQPKDKNDACAYFKKTPSKKYILYGAVNALQDPNKGWSNLQEALCYFVNKYGSENIELIIFGANEQFTSITLPISTTFWGYMKEERDMVMLYNLADVMVVPSLYENLPQTAVEAIACGTPVVAFRTSGLVDIVEHQQNGYLAECYSPQDLAEGINWCMNNSLNRELSKNAREKVVRCFSEEVVNREYVKLYKTII